MRYLFKKILIVGISILLVSSTTLADTNVSTSPQSITDTSSNNQVKKKIIRKHPIQHKKRVSPQGSSTGKVCISCIGSQAQ